MEAIETLRKATESLTLHLINTRNPRPEHIDLCERAYQFWHDSWTETFSTLGAKGKETFGSDDFLDREVIALFSNQQPVALFFMNQFDISRDSIVRHSYFKNYPKESIQFLRDKGITTTMALSYVTVHSDWRAKDTDVPVADLLFSIAMKRFWETGLDCVIGYIRTDKKYFESFYRHGAMKISESIAYNVPVDFCYITEESSHLSTIPGVAEITEKIWKRMKDDKLKIVRNREPEIGL